MKVRGIIIKGKGRGRKFGFPTANVALKKEIPSGVYKGSIHIKGKKYQAAIFVGKNKKILEAYVLDFNGDLYGKKIEVEIGKKIRKAMDFKNEEELIEQIKKDLLIIYNFRQGRISLWLT